MITPQRMLAFVELVRDLREMQDEHRRTQDARLRNRLPAMQMRVDAELAFVHGMLMLDVGEAERDAAVVVEGGAA